MEFFTTTLNQMLVLFAFMLIGFLTRRLKILPEDSDRSISRLENYILVPCLIINTFMTRCTLDNLRGRMDSVLYSILVLSFSMLLGFIFSPLLAESKEEKGLYRYSFTVANFGFVGNAVVKGVFGEDMLFNYMIYSLAFNLFTYSVGVIWLTSGKKKFTFRMLLNPTFVSLILGAFLGITSMHLPKFLESVISSASSCFSPMAMLLTGFVIAGFDFRTLFSQKKVYLMSVCRLIVLPAIIYGILRLLKAPDVVLTTAVCCAAMPLGLNTIVFPAAYGGDMKPGASMAMISNLMGVITIPVILTLLLAF